MDPYMALRRIVLLSDHPNVPDQPVLIDGAFQIDRGRDVISLQDGTDYDVTGRRLS